MNLKFNLLILLLSTVSYIQASKLVKVEIVDREYIMVHFKDGDVLRKDDGKGKCAFYGHCHSADGSYAKYYGDRLDVGVASSISGWRLQSKTDRDYRKSGQQPVAVHRKTKLNGMTISHYDPEANDYVYDHTIEHYIYLKLPRPLKQGESSTCCFAEPCQPVNGEKQPGGVAECRKIL